MKIVKILAIKLIVAVKFVKDLKNSIFITQKNIMSMK